MVALIVAISFFALVAGLVREHVLPQRRARRHRAALIESLGVEFGMVPVEIKGDGTTLLRGSFNDSAVDIDIASRGCTIVMVNLSARAVPHDLRIYETSSWSYQKQENRMLGLTVDTGDREFDAGFDVNSVDTNAATRLPARVRRTLVAHRGRGLMICNGVLTLGSGSATPYFYLSDQPDTHESVTEMLEAATALALALEQPA